jgi:cytochrome c1
VKRVAWILIVLLLVSCSRNEHERAATQMTGGGVPERGKAAIEKYGCGSCHTIPGVAGANSVVAPPLTSVGSRMYLAGHIRNTPENMMQWIQHPQQHEPKTVMPNMGVTESDARDIAAYLYTLR